MRKTAVLLAAALLLLMNVCPAGAETYVYQALGFENQAVTADFSAGLEPDLMNALADAGFTGDPLICGVMCETYQKRDQDEWRSQWAVMVLLHEGKSLMIYGTRDFRNGWFPWTLTPASEIFLPAGEQTDLRALPLRDMRTGEITDVLPAIVMGQTTYYLTKRGGRLYSIRTEEGNGAMTEIFYRENGQAQATVWRNGQEQETYNARFLWPLSLEFWRIQDVPVDISGLKAFESAHPLPSAEEYGVATGGNFRAEATGASESLGYIVCARVRVLGSKQGSQYPWYHVTLGDMEGWISFPYLNQVSSANGEDILNDWAQVQGVGMLQRDEALRTSPGGGSSETLAAGRMVHILLRQNGYYYVSIPQGEISWHQEDGAAFGWVKTDALKTYTSPLQARYGMGATKLIADP